MQLRAGLGIILNRDLAWGLGAGLSTGRWVTPGYARLAGAERPGVPIR